MASPYDRSLGFRYAILLLACALLIWIVVSPWLQWWVGMGIGNLLLEQEDELAAWDAVRARGVLLLLYAWVFTFGATIGSFLNVVIWRMPRGESVAARGSRCPFCCTPIRPSDNIPVLGWWLLGGRCRTCLLPISPRYPLVEGVTGLLFLSLLHWMVLSGGANLPGFEEPRFVVGSAIMNALEPRLWGQLAYWALLLCLLLVWSLIAWDRQRMPLKLLIFGAGVGLVAPIMFPFLYPWEGIPGLGGDPIWGEHVSALCTAILGGWAGAAWGWILGIILAPKLPRTHLATLPMMLCVGLFLGWQASCLVAGLAMFALLLGYPLAKCRDEAKRQHISSLLLLLAAWIWMLNGPRLETLGGASLGQIAVAASLVAVVSAAIVRWLGGEKPMNLDRFRSESARITATPAPALAPTAPGQEN
ncbi:MAG: prepilin peptidase [Pirellulaceae bacterium]